MSEIVQYQGSEIATAQQVVAHTIRVQEIMKAVMKPEVHYGVIPGTKKNTLFKPGAEALCVAFHITPTYDVMEERFDDGVRYRVVCHGVHQGSGRIVADGIGSCSSMEEKYKWRKTMSRKEFDSTDPARRRIDFGYNKAERREYEILQVRVETADVENTLLKMASKRAMIAMVLNALAVSDIFAQDLDGLSRKVVDMMADDEGAGETQQERRAPVQSKGEAAAAANGNGAPAQQSGNAPAQEPAADKPSPPASEGMLRLIRAKAKAAGVEEPAIVAKHGIEKLEAATVKLGNEILAGIGSGAYKAA